MAACQQLILFGKWLKITPYMFKGFAGNDIKVKL